MMVRFIIVLMIVKSTQKVWVGFYAQKVQASYQCADNSCTDGDDDWGYYPDEPSEDEKKEEEK